MNKINDFNNVNIATHIASTIIKQVDRMLLNFGKMGSFAPVDDSKSGIQIGDKTYNVVQSLNGCYYWIDEDGNKNNINNLPEGSWEWVNIAEKTLQHFKTCYRTPGGKVEVWSWYQLNDEMEVLKEKHRITDSTDLDTPVGTYIDAIPSGWVMIDCDLPDMTERDVTFVNRCYDTGNGKVEIEGLEAIDDRLQIRESIYGIIQSTDEDYPAGTTFVTIPSTWVRVVCDFPDMTERDVTYVLECYETADGKVQVEGLLSIDGILGVRNEVYTVLQTTDANYPAGTVLTSIPGSWTRMECDFPDMTDREVIDVDQCYETGEGLVELKGYRSVDGELAIRVQYYYVVNTTDDNYPLFTLLTEVPDGWVMAACDFTDLTERTVLPVDECWATRNGKVRLGGYRSVDGEANVRAMYLIVLESTDEDINRGTVYTAIPEGWVQAVCDFPSEGTADTEIVENCYDTGSGKVELRSYLTFDGYGKLRSSRHLVMRSTDASYPFGREIDEIPVGWTNTECDFASLTERHVMKVTYCFRSSAGDIYTDGYEVLDNNLDVKSMKLIVLESTDPSISVGDSFTEVPDGYTRIPCDDYGNGEGGGGETTIFEVEPTEIRYAATGGGENIRITVDEDAEWFIDYD